MVFASVSPVKIIDSYGKINYPLIDENLNKLHVDGTQIIDSHGNRVKLSGFNVHGIWSAAYDEYQPWIAADENDLVWMEDKGFNCVRLVMYWEDIETSKGVYNLERLGYIDDFIDLCEEHGIYVILDCHQWGYSSKFPMAGSIGRGIPHWAGPEDYPSTESGRNQFIIDLWANQGPASASRSHLIDFWKMLASRYEGKNCIFAYDLFNEPWSPHVGEPEGSRIIQQYQEFFDKELAPAIRAVDQHTTLIYSVAGISHRWLYDSLEEMNRPTITNVIGGYNHYAESWEEEGNYDSSKRSKIDEIFQAIHERYIVEFGIPIIITEIGGDMTKDNNLQWLDDSLDAYSNVFGEHASWTYWRYGKEGMQPDEGWYPRWNWNEPPQGTHLKDMPVVAVLTKTRP